MNKELKDVYGFIYITTNLANGKRYIGQKKLEEGTHLYRWKSYLGSGVLLNKAIDKYGKENFVRDIVAVAYNEEELNKLEIEWINNYDAINNDNYYNVAEGGRKNPFAGKSKEEMNDIRRRAGKSISKINKGENHPNFGKKTSEDIKRKISESLKKRYKEDEELRLSKKFQDKKGVRTKIPKKVICVTTGEIFSSAQEASEYYNVDRTSISRCCANKRKTAGELQGIPMEWEYHNP